MWIDLILRMLLLVGQTALLMVVEEEVLPVSIFTWVILFTCQFLLTVLKLEEGFDRSWLKKLNPSSALLIYAMEMMAACLISPYFYYYWPLFAFDLHWFRGMREKEPVS